MDHNSLVNEVVNNPKSPKEFACANEITKLRKELAGLEGKPVKEKPVKESSKSKRLPKTPGYGKKS